MKISKDNGSNFKIIGVFLINNHEKTYKSPKKANNSEEKKEMERLFKAGQESNKIFNDILSVLAAENNLFDIKNKNFLDGSFKKIRNYYWGQLKSPDYYMYPESISVFCEVVNNKDVRFRVSLELDEKKADEEEKRAFLSVLNKPLKKDLCYMGNLVFNRSLEIILNKNEVKEKLSTGIYNKVQISYLVKNCESNEEMIMELDKGIKLLLPYYDYIMK